MLNCFSQKGLTPFQGGENQRVFGEFKCSKCKNTWRSGNSWRDMGQECTACRVNVYPYKQDELKSNSNSKEKDSGKPHLQNLCEKCKSLGRCCTQFDR